MVQEAINITLVECEYKRQARYRLIKIRTNFIKSDETKLNIVERLDFQKRDVSGLCLWLCLGLIIYIYLLNQ